MAKEHDWEFLKNLGQRVASLRKEAGVSQEKLAEKAGLHRTYVGFIEQGKRDPSIGVLRRVALALGLKVEEIFSQPLDFSAMVVQDAAPKKSTKKKRA